MFLEDVAELLESDQAGLPALLAPRRLIAGQNLFVGKLFDQKDAPVTNDPVVGLFAGRSMPGLLTMGGGSALETPRVQILCRGHDEYGYSAAQQMSEIIYRFLDGHLDYQASSGRSYGFIRAEFCPYFLMDDPEQRPIINMTFMFYENQNVGHTMAVR